MLNSLRFEELILTDSRAEFPARYIAACNLRRLVAAAPEEVPVETIRTLEQLMVDPHLLRERQSFFFFRETAGCLAALMTGANDTLTHQARRSLQGLLRHASGSSHRAATEALGSLPLPLSPPRPAPFPDSASGETNWQALLRRFDLTPDGIPIFAGRSLIQPLAAGEKLLVAKFCRHNESSSGLRDEITWMATLSRFRATLPAGFHVPRPLVGDATSFFRITDLPVPPPIEASLRQPLTAILYIARQDYFTYANEPDNFTDFAQARDIIGRNSLILGHLSGRGIVHTAPIPLFHNRVQRHRREDHGLYNWPLAGRLDQWLASCRFPNMGMTGARDFEHFIAVEQSGERFYWHIGSHFLSLLLVAASFFRNRNKALTGLDPAGQPVDARSLFDRDHLRQVLETIFLSYYQGFTGEDYQGELPVDFDTLAERMIEEMGVDRHMEEILRQVDQQQMNDEEFYDFLEARGLPQAQARRAVRGVADIVLHTGPHLGGFNQQISIPELISATATMAATCVLGRYFHDPASTPAQ